MNDQDGIFLRYITFFHYFDFALRHLFIGKPHFKLPYLNNVDIN